MIPLTGTAQHLAYAGKVRDSRGNLVDAWSDPVTITANWYISSSHEPQIAGHDRSLVDAQLFVPSDFTASPRDRFTLPGREGVFDVLGEVEDYNHGPFSGGWPRVVNLRKVTG